MGTSSLNMIIFLNVLWQMIWLSLMWPGRLTLKKSVVSDCHLIRICPSGKIMLTWKIQADVVMVSRYLHVIYLNTRPQTLKYGLHRLLRHRENRDFGCSFS